MEEKKRCPGCGAVFQTADENLPGFLAPGKEPKEGVLCKRCFQMKHYGVFRKALISDPNIQKELRRNPRVKSFRLGVYGEGEDGVTVVQLK